MTSNAMHLHFYLTLLHNCTKWIMDVSPLCWRSYTCFCPFCGSPKYFVLMRNFFITCLHSFLLYSECQQAMKVVLHKATAMRLLVSHHSVLSTSKWAGGYYHYSLSFLPLACWPARTVQASEAVVYMGLATWCIST